MRKQELVHLHGLLVGVRRYLDEHEDVAVPTGAFDAYDGYGIGPTAIADRKDAHREAVDRLLDGLNVTVTAQRTAEDAAPVPSDPAEGSHVR